MGCQTEAQGAAGERTGLLRVAWHHTARSCRATGVAPGPVKFRIQATVSAKGMGRAMP